MLHHFFIDSMRKGIHTCCLLLLTCVCAYAQNTISGKITSELDNSPLSGVTVIVKGASKGVISNNDGNYSINAPGNAVLIFSSITYGKKEIPVNNQTLINVALQERVTGLDEVVVIGYGTQKKVNLTGSVSTIGAKELTKRPVTNVENLLQGKIPGLQVTQAYGKPGNEANLMRIRGTGTFSDAGSNPLVLIDGITGDLSNLDPNDVESVSVLKDAASSAIYGARAANGVILVTTKKGKAQPVTIEYSGNVQIQQATKLPKLLYNSADYMTYWNQGRIRNGELPWFTQADIDSFRNSTDPVKFPNYNWIKNLFHTATVQNHHININGGNDKTTFNLSLGYLDQGGVVSIFDFKKYNALLSVDTKVNDWITVGGKVEMIKKDIKRNNFDVDDGETILAIYGAGPNYTPTMTLPDGTTGYVARYSRSIGEWTVRNSLAEDASGSITENRYNVATQFYADVKLGNNLSWLTKGGVTYDNNFFKLHENHVSNYFFQDGSYATNNGTYHLGVRDQFDQNLLTTLYSTLNYHKIFDGVHEVNVLAGYNQESNFYRMLYGQKSDFPTANIQELNAGSDNGQVTQGTANEWAIRSFFGRLAYNYKGKYLFEANSRYDGTSRISPSNRWGFFPSLSAAWRLSEESFLKKYSWLDNLKLRGSWGQLGNQNVGLYPYQEMLTTDNAAYPFSDLNPGVQMTSLVDKSLKWEVTTMTDFGMDVNVKNGLFTATFDWYNKVTDNILYQIPVPASVGLSAPTVNYGKMKNTGWEFELGHGQQIGDFRYNVSFNLSSSKNEVLKVLAPSYDNHSTIQEGLPFGSYYMIQWIGIFQDQAEIDKSPKQSFNPKPGDLKFKDQNGDGIIDAKDRVVVNGAYAKFYYGGSLNLSWKNFDLTAFFQGVQGQKFFVQGAWGLMPYVQGGPPTLDFVKNMWTPTNHTNKYPAMFAGGYLPVTGTNSTYFLLDASYMRLKNLAIGYNIPKSFSRKIGSKDIRIYVSGDNLLTFTKYPEGDPERVLAANKDYANGRTSTYPQLRIYTFGINVKF